MKNNVLKGSLFVALGACCYGMLGTFVKMAYQDGFSTAEVVLSQFGLGTASLFVLNFTRKGQGKALIRPGIKSKVKLLVGGISLGLTSISYYMAVRYIPVSVGIVLLMQTVWMSVVLEMILKRQLPGARKTFSALMVMAGTVLAVNMSTQPVGAYWPGLGWGLFSALCYTTTMYSSNHIELHLPPLKRSLYMILGGCIIIALVFHSSINPDFSFRIFQRWGPLVSLFGTILPPLLFTRGMPLTGIGLGAIIAAIEIPTSVLMANQLLQEPVMLSQWLGIAVILAAVVLMNLKKVSSKKVFAGKSGT